MNEATGKVVLYKALDGSIAMDVRLQGETVWLTQKQMSELFDHGAQRHYETLAKHISIQGVGRKIS